MRAVASAEKAEEVRRVYPAHRRRPAMRGGRPTLNRDRIAQAALELAGEAGFAAVTMRAVAERLSVSVAALYKHVPDRQIVVDLAAARFLESMPDRHYDPSRDWRDTIADTCQQLRAAYRRYPRATLIAIDETVTEARMPDSHVLGPERMIAYLRDLGLSPADAIAVRWQLLLDVFGFVLPVDYRHDHGGSAVPPGPAVWLDQRPHLDTPRLQEAREVAPTNPDTLFATVIDTAITLIAARLRPAP